MSYVDELQGYGAEDSLGNPVTGAGSSFTTYTVSNLNDSGVGSLREALEATGARYVRFDGLSGDITVGPTRIEINDPNITIDFTTASEKGIQLKGHANLTQAPIRVATSNVIIKGLKSRPGTSTSTPDALQMNAADGVWIDHCDLMFGVDECLDIWQSSTNITVSFCIIAYGLDTPGTSLGALFGNSSTNITLKHCLLAHNHGRNPRIACPGPVEVINCVIYNPVDHPMTTTNEAVLDLIGCVYRQGPDSIRDYILATNDATDGGDLYHDDNVYPGASLIRAADVSKYTISGTPLASPPVATHVIPSEYVLEYVLNNVGARLPVVDTLTQGVIDDVRDGTGTIISAPSDVGGYPTLTSITYEFILSSIKTLTGSNPNLTVFRVQFYNTGVIKHVADFICRLPITRSWSNGESGSTNKLTALMGVLLQFVTDHSADYLTGSLTSDLLTRSTNTTDPDGWIADEELAAIVGNTRSLS